MTKVIEAFNKVVDYLKENTYYVEYLSPELNIIQRELESIDNANPSEAMKSLEKIKDSFGCDMAYYNLNLEYETVEQALLKAKEQEKVLSIIKEKNIDIIFTKENITEEEIELVQRYCNE